MIAFASCGPGEWFACDVLSNLTSDNVHIAFGDANSSALVTLPERDDYKDVVMPMRI